MKKSGDILCLYYNKAMETKGVGCPWFNYTKKELNYMYVDKDGNDMGSPRCGTVEVPITRHWEGFTYENGSIEGVIYLQTDGFPTEYADRYESGEVWLGYDDSDKFLSYLKSKDNYLVWIRNKKKKEGIKNG